MAGVTPSAEFSSGSGKESRAAVVEALRQMWVQIPAMHTLLRDPEIRRQLVEAILPLVPEPIPPPSLNEQATVLTARGYTVIPPGEMPPPPPAPARRSRPEPPPALAATPTSLRTQGGKLLAAYAVEGERGMTYDEAKAEASIEDRESAWKRVSELRMAGLIEYLFDGSGEITHRPGESGVQQQVCIITDYGKAVLATLEDI